MTITLPLLYGLVKVLSLNLPGVGDLDVQVAFYRYEAVQVNLIKHAPTISELLSATVALSWFVPFLACHWE